MTRSEHGLRPPHPKAHQVRWHQPPGGSTLHNLHMHMLGSLLTIVLIQNMGGIISKGACSDDVGTSKEGWKSYLTTEEVERVLQEAHLIQQGNRPECHGERQGSAIFWASTSCYSLRCKLAELLVALEDGANPNEEESMLPPQARSGRPLDVCLDDTKSDMAEKSLLNNIPVIQMLLDYGADPRLDPIPKLKGLPPCPLKPVEEAPRQARVAKGPMKEFYEEAHRVLKKSADRLDRLDDAPGSEKGGRLT